MSNLGDRIISVILDIGQCVLTDKEIHIALNKEGILCSVEDIHRQVHLLSPALFQLKTSDNQTAVIHVDPKVKHV